MAIQPGLVAGLWRRGMRAEDTIHYLRVFTGPNGRLAKGQDRQQDIMHTVIDACLTRKGLPRDAEIDQSEMNDLVKRRFGATRSAEAGSSEASNTVLHWSEYRQPRLITPHGLVDVPRVAQLAAQVFEADHFTCADALSWSAKNRPKSAADAAVHKTAKAMLKKKRKQGRVIPKRGRR